ncbi:hypothetical protein HBI04_204380 [Parastagonospora nodorum]|nr:hypothetical protein HBH50_089480 [Parastagonospora nodorum]KAH4092908.1 hypothetical protein HBH48_073910 [Parastagonospora nodorum]KAH4206754.1 hypothetical protein HBI95_120070 [Parastagonospora nodorum]KAH4253528.1 hypothetical protein HBI03_192980 [Parastagonospora nodorum]KAH4261473.1 hypothetical protein HBI04_204380 [Parastagonospora nodorum]
MRYDVRLHFDCTPRCDLHAKCRKGFEGPDQRRRACIMLKKKDLPVPPVLDGVFDAGR